MDLFSLEEISGDEWRMVFRPIMIFYYVFLGVLGLFTVVFVFGGIYVLVEHRRQPLRWRVDQVRNDLLKKESTTGSSELNAGMYSKVSNEMLRDVAKSEGFRFTGKSNRYLAFQRPLPTSDETQKRQGLVGDPVGDDFGGKQQRERLRQTLSIADDPTFLKLRRDELGAVPKAEILRTAREHGWAFQEEEISGNEWSLLFRSRADQAAQGAVG